MSCSTNLCSCCKHGKVPSGRLPEIFRDFPLPEITGYLVRNLTGKVLGRSHLRISLKVSKYFG